MARAPAASPTDRRAVRFQVSTFDPGASAAKWQIEAGRQVQAAGEFLHLVRRLLLGFCLRIGMRRDDQIFENIRLIRVHQARVDLDTLQLALAAEGHGDHPGCRRALDRHLCQALLHLRYLGL